ncbi:hypothetical protein Ciccas_008708 [Cichlidogyrus casuarinus]|uniref:Hyaluronan/mRNA-binding protein domain-containing protein n=1 Tax=Cichlidogyrus casuarinus TaxID=1844966 RepID=A0ABD2PZ45_9PLAT
MAVHDGYQYTVEVKSRFALLDLDEEELESALHKQKSDTTEDRHDNQANTKGRNQRNTQVKQAVTRKPAAGNEAIVDHMKDEHKQNKHRGHVPPHRGREFDRKSGSDKTGVKAVPKKDGHGTGNWGTVQDEIDATMTEQTDVLDTSNEIPENNEPAEPEPKTLTLEEYKAMQKTIIKEVAAVRPANDGKDVFKNMKLLATQKETIEVDQPKFSSVYHSVNDSGIKISMSSKPTGRGRGGGVRGRGRGGRGGFGEDRERPPRKEGEERPRKEGEVGQRGGRPSRGAPRGAGPQAGRGTPRGAPRGGRGAGTGNENRTHAPAADGHRFKENDFPALG